MYLCTAQYHKALKGNNITHTDQHATNKKEIHKEECLSDHADKYNNRTLLPAMSFCQTLGLPVEGFSLCPVDGAIGLPYCHHGRGKRSSQKCIFNILYT